MGCKGIRRVWGYEGKGSRARDSRRSKAGGMSAIRHRQLGERVGDYALMEIPIDEKPVLGTYNRIRG